MMLKPVGEHTYEVSGIRLEDVTSQKFLVFDVEATGLDVKNDHVTQFGCVPVIDGVIVETEAFLSYVRTEKHIPEAIGRLTGVTDKHVRDAPHFKDVMAPLFEKYRNHVWVAQCGFEFDFQIIESMCERHGIVFLPGKRMDTKVLFAYINPGLNETFSTDFFKRHYGIDSSGMKRHDALGDSLLIARVLQKILADYIRRKVKNLILGNPIMIKKFVPKSLA